MEKKVRIDTLLVEKALFETREKAKKALMSGIIYVDNQKVDKAGMKVNAEANIEVRGKALPYVSRGGLKIEKAIEKYEIDLKDKTCMDVGASTGGFTDCMLQNGAKKVFSIDVGYGQLDWKLRQDERVVCMERTNVRYVKPEDIGEGIDFASIDVSFISLKIVLPVVKELVKENGQVIFLIKPQFEAGRKKVGKKGVVRDKRVHKEVIEELLKFTYELGLTIEGLTYSPIKGPKGNIEFLAYVFNKPSEEELDVEKLALEVVERAHQGL
ncbi:TlyA family RNA methyltransferase [Wukongibacter baidiensis]|uniref:TlyA family RNA methyltransferase n=1 Tax=Wukongibacter baidiensis TaxID=1723361 RepID=UPI003D7F502B